MAGSLNPHRTRTFTLIAVLLLALIFLKPFLPIIALAALAAYLFDPIYKRCLRRFKDKKSVAVACTTVLSLVFILLPIVIILLISVSQATRLAHSLGLEGSFSNMNLTETLSSTVTKLNEIIQNITGIEGAIKSGSVIDFVKEVGPKLAQAFADIIISLVSTIPGLITSFILYLFVFTGIMVGQDKLLANIRAISPFDEKVTAQYFRRIGLMCKSMVKGQMIIALAQGLASALVIAAVLNLWELFIFMFIIFTFLSFIPLGAGIITIPLGIIVMLTGHWWQGGLILLNHFLVVTNIDNFRPRLVAKEIRLPAALTILAAFAGVHYFGLLGVVYGPIIMIFITTTIEMYVKENSGQKLSAASNKAQT